MQPVRPQQRGPARDSSRLTNMEPPRMPMRVLAARCRTVPRIVANVLRYVHRTEVRATHRAEVGKLGTLLRKRFVVVFARDFRVKRKIELILPTEFKSGFGQCVVAVLGSGMALGQVSCVRSKF